MDRATGTSSAGHTSPQQKRVGGRVREFVRSLYGRVAILILLAVIRWVMRGNGHEQLNYNPRMAGLAWVSRLHRRIHSLAGP